MNKFSFVIYLLLLCMEVVFPQRKKKKKERKENSLLYEKERKTLTKCVRNGYSLKWDLHLKLMKFTPVLNADMRLVDFLRTI